MIYLDNSATTRVYDEVIDEMTKVMKKDFGNPSSLHTLGLEAERILKESRKSIEKMFPGRGSLVFTSGGTESDNMALIGAFNSRKRISNRIVTTSIEHPAVLETVKALAANGAEVVFVDVDKDNKLNLEMLENELEKGAAIVSIMAVNNETGALMPICKVRDIIKDYRDSTGDDEKGNKNAPILHTDAVQAFGKEDITTIPADLISVSAHKLHGPKGVGALFIGNDFNISPVISGGGQEKGLRSGTENMPGIAGFGKACELVLKDKDRKGEVIRSIRDELKTGIIKEIPDVRINSPEDGSPYILNVSFLGTRGEVLLHTLEQDGIMVSTGAACSSGKNSHKSGSHVLKAMGLPEDVVESAIRFSFGAFNTPDEVPYVLDKLKSAVNNFRRLGSFR